MPARISNRLATEIEKPAGGPAIRLHLLLRSGLSDDAIARIAARVRELAEGEVEVLPRMRVILAPASPSAISDIAAIEGVEWIDREGVAPVESLLD